MLVAFWSVKGGVGTTVVTAGAALAAARSSPGRPVLLVDLAGDLPACLGLPDPEGPGVAEWVGAGLEVPPDALARLETPVAPGLALLHRGTGPLDGDRCGLLVQVLAGSGRTVVVDCGRVERRDGVARVVSEANRSVLVVRPCILGLRRAFRAPLRASGLVVVREPGRSLSTEDVGRSLSAPVLAEVAYDPAVARAVDAGLLTARVPRALGTALGRVAA